MAKETPQRAVAPSDVTVRAVVITVGRPVRGRAPRERVAGIRVVSTARTALAAALALVALAPIVVVVLQSSWTRRPGGAVSGQASAVERAAIAAAFGYPYPLRCLTITISPSDSDYARADVDRANGCGRYHGYLNASFHRVDGRWRLVLDEGQLFVPNSLLTPCRVGQAGCARRRSAGWQG